MAESQPQCDVRQRRHGRARACVGRAVSKQHRHTPADHSLSRRRFIRPGCDCRADRSGHSGGLQHRAAPTQRQDQNLCGADQHALDSRPRDSNHRRSGRTRALFAVLAWSVGEWPQKYNYGQLYAPHTNNVRSARKIGLKNGLRGHLYPPYCLREWWWGGDGERDHSLYDRDGLTLARIVGRGGYFPDDDLYDLRSPTARPPRSWRGLERAKRGAETVALWALPNRKRDKIEIAKRPVADWYDRLDGSSDYYNEEGRHVIRLIHNGNTIRLAKPVMSGSWQDRDEAKAAALAYLD